MASRGSEAQRLCKRYQPINERRLMEKQINRKIKMLASVR